MHRSEKSLAGSARRRSSHGVSLAPHSVSGTAERRAAGTAACTGRHWASLWRLVAGCQSGWQQCTIAAVSRAHGLTRRAACDLGLDWWSWCTSSPMQKETRHRSLVPVGTALAQGRRAAQSIGHRDLRQLLVSATLVRHLLREVVRPWCWDNLTRSTTLCARYWCRRRL